MVASLHLKMYHWQLESKSITKNRLISIKNVEKTAHISIFSLLSQKLREFALLTKMSLSVTVVLSGALGYLFGVDYALFSASQFVFFILAGLLVTWSASAFNEVFEKDIDALMDRTKGRPIPAGQISASAALFIAGVMAVAGVLLLWFKFSALAAVLGAVCVFSYAFVYTPMKKVSSVAVFIGAIPGALPPAIGYVCATYPVNFSYFVCTTLFFIQFLWQFPHFWSIAWLRFDDYKKAGIMMLPSASGKTKYSSVHAFLYAAFLLIVSVIPYTFGMVGVYGTTVMVLMGAIYMVAAANLYKNNDDQSAKKLLFASFFYLPVTQLAMVLDKI